MTQTIQLERTAALCAMGAAVLIAGDFGRHRTGLGFVLFCIVSLLWIAVGAIRGEAALIVQNGIMLAINLYGVWRYLISPREKRVIDRMNEVAEVAEREVEQELNEGGRQ
jgi:uncharacterized membrane protein